MKKKGVEGYCHICGEFTKLTFEHIPPHKAFNYTPARVIQGDEAIKLVTENGRLPWDTSNLRYKNMQKGMGGYTLCGQCNNLTGTLYGDMYILTAHSMVKLMLENNLKVNEMYTIHINNIKLSRFARQVLSMFCSTCPSLREQFPQIKDILLKKEKLVNPPFKIKAYLLRNTKISYTGIMAILTISVGVKSVAQIDAFPFSFVLELDDFSNSDGWDITKYLTMDIDDEINEDIRIKYIEHNTMFPNDFRTKDLLEKILGKEQ